MLDRGSHDEEVVRWIESQPCYVKIPDRLAADFEKRGPSPTLPDEQRVNARMRCGSASLHAAVRCLPTLPALARKDSWHVAYPTDISKKGCRFLHFEPLYPSELCEIVFGTGLRQKVEVMWCRRVDESCFSVGARFTDSAPQPSNS